MKWMAYLALWFGPLWTVVSLHAQTPLILEQLTTTAPASPDTFGHTRIAANALGQSVWLRQAGNFNPVELLYFNQAGQNLWQISFQDAPDRLLDRAEVTLDDEGAVLLTGTRVASLPPNAIELVLHKFDSTGQRLWSWSTPAGEPGTFPAIASVRPDSAGNILLTGTRRGHYLVEKISAAGAVLWSASDEDPANPPSRGADAIELANGTVVMVGAQQQLSGNSVPILRRFGSDGAPHGTLELPFELSFFITRMHLATDGGFYLGGHYRLMKFDASEQFAWFKDLFIDIDNLVLAGPDRPFVISNSGFLLLDSEGNELAISRQSLPSEFPVAANQQNVWIALGNEIRELRPDTSLASSLALASEERQMNIVDMAVAGKSVLAVGEAVRFIPEIGPVHRAFFLARATAAVDTAFPRITAQPAGRMALAGERTELRVQAESSAALSYQWFRIVQTGLSVREVLPNATNAAFLLENLSPADSGAYGVEVSTAAGTVSSAFASLDVQKAPIFTGPVTARPVRPYVGDRVLFRASFEATTPLRMQWYRDGIPLENATNINLAIEAITPADLGRYSLLVSNQVGHAFSAEYGLTNFLDNVRMTSSLTGRAATSLNAGRDQSGNLFVLTVSSITPVVTRFSLEGVPAWSTDVSRLAAVANVGERPLFATSADGTSYLIGRSTTSLTNRTAVAVNASGEILWQRDISAAMPSPHTLLPYSGRLLIAGVSSRSLALLCLEPDGTQRWLARAGALGSTINPQFFLSPGTGGEIYLANDSSGILHRIGSDEGQLLWSVPLTNSFRFCGLQPGLDGSVLTAFSSRSPNRFGVLKFDREGRREWLSWLLPSPSPDFQETIPFATAADGSACLVTRSSFRSVLTRLDPSGKIAWESTLPTDREPQLQMHSPDRIDLLSAVGNARVLARFDRAGVRRWERVLPSMANHFLLSLRPGLTAVLGTGGPSQIVLFEDRESEQMKRRSARILAEDAPAGALLRLAVQSESEPLGLSWSSNSVPVASPGAELSIPWSGRPAGYGVEVQFADSVLRTPDAYYDRLCRFERIETTAEGLIRLTLRGVAGLSADLQRTQDFLAWERAALLRFPSDGPATVEIQLPSNGRPAFYRVFRPL